MIIAVLKAREVAGDFAEALPAFAAVAKFVKVVEVFGHFGKDDAGEVLEGVTGAFVVGEFMSLLGDLLEAFLALLVAEPILVAAMAPFGEVLFADRFAVEGGVNEVPGLRQFVEPLEEGSAEFAVEEAEVELFAGLVRETGDFADASFHRMNF